MPIINDGGEEYAKIGIERSTGTKLISAGGNVKNPGVYEIELGVPVEEFIYSDEYCGGIANGKRLKALVAGGSSVPIDLAVKGALAGKFRFGGQTCVCVNRILVQEGIHDLFVEKFTAAVKKMKLGSGLDPDVSIGPLINQRAIRRMEEMTKDAIAKGGHVVTGGNAVAPQFFEPTIIVDANESMEFAQNEIFGPIAPIFKFKTEQDAVRIANDTIYGLASYFFTNDLNRSWRVREQLEYGIVGINEGLISSEVVPFGGVKESGQGREGSKYGLDSYVDIKYVCIGGVV